MEENLQKEKIFIQKSEAQINNQLKDVKPLIMEAQKAVGNISKSNLKEAAGYCASHKVISDVFTVLEKMIGQQDTSARAIKVLFSQRGVIERILNFDPRSIPQSMVDSIKVEIAEKAHSFEK